MLGLSNRFSLITKSLLLSALIGPWLSGCSDATSDQGVTVKPQLVLTYPIKHDATAQLELTGTVKARKEIPIAFQVSGRIAERKVEAGQLVKKGEELYRLDPKDLTEALRVAQAGQAAAKASLDTATAELNRTQELIKKRFISEQASEQAQLKFNEAKANLDKANAQQQQAAHALSYAVIRASAAGIITDISAEPGQVVSAGQRLAALATIQAIEIEVQLPEQITPPAEGFGQVANSQIVLKLRSAAGSADSASLTRQARYQVLENNSALRLGQVLPVTLPLNSGNNDVLVPIAALDERGKNPQIWHIVDGKAQSAAVQIKAMNGDFATISTELPNGTPVIALGTHLLATGMAVEELKP
jgi:RND family efflux transporter MFP subunit